MMANIKLRYNIFLGAILTLLAVSCSNEQEPQIPDPDEGRETSVVDISVSLGDSWDIDVEGTRAAPPSTVDKSDSSSEIAAIDSVKIFTFRRKEGSDGEFYRDKTNEKTILVEKTEPVESNHDNSESHTHSIARGTITKTYGYEYRVIAIAYPTTIYGSNFPHTIDKYSIDSDSWISIKGTTYSSFCANLLPFGFSNWNDYLTGATLGGNNTNHINNQILQTPQIFYGTLRSKDSNSDIIPYADVDKDGNMDSKVGLTGILKRGVAKVTIEFQITKNNSNTIFGGSETEEIKWITVLAETPNKKVGLKNYDDFLCPSDSIEEKYKYWSTTQNKNVEEYKYTAIAYITPEVQGVGTEKKPVDFYLLPGKTKLAIRVQSIKTSNLVGTSYNKYLRNGQLKGNAVESHGNNGTGIVSPDFDGEVFYFRRNHKYTITVSNPLKVITDYPLD